jgi:hypothetical protein
MAIGRWEGKSHWQKQALFADQADEHIVEAPGTWKLMDHRKKGDAGLKEPGRKRVEVEAGMSPPSKVDEKHRRRELGVRSSCSGIGCEFHGELPRRV